MIRGSEWHWACSDHYTQEEDSIPELVASLNHAIPLKLSRFVPGVVPGVGNVPLLSESESFLSLCPLEWSTMT